MGTEADTVIPTLSNRYSDEAPKTMPSPAPTRTAGQVNSGIWTLSGTYGLWPGVGSDSGEPFSKGGAAIATVSNSYRILSAYCRNPGSIGNCGEWVRSLDGKKRLQNVGQVFNLP